jgi:hypothetical protein
MVVQPSPKMIHVIKYFMNPITIRKTLARFAFYVSKSKEGMTHSQITKELDLSETEFDYLMESCISISNSSDYDLNVICVDSSSNYPIGGTEIVNSNGRIVAFL